MAALTNDEVITLFTRQLPQILEERPEIEPFLYHDSLARKEDVATVHQEVIELRAEVTELRQEMTEFKAEMTEFKAETRAEFRRVDQDITDLRTEMRDGFRRVDGELADIRTEMRSKFEEVDRRFDKVEADMAAGFKEVYRHIDRLGGRWGIRNESLFRETMAELLEKSFGVAVKRMRLGGEEFDVIISNGQHILIEIAASVTRKIQERLERKRDLYTEATGQPPARIILAVASIHSVRAAALRQAGFEVVEPEEEETI